MPKAVIFDYGVGNLLSLKCALEKAGLDPGIFKAFGLLLEPE